MAGTGYKQADPLGILEDAEPSPKRLIDPLGILPKKKVGGENLLTASPTKLSLDDAQKIRDFAYGLKTPEEKQLAQPSATTKISTKPLVSVQKETMPTDEENTKEAIDRFKDLNVQGDLSKDIDPVRLRLDMVNQAKVDFDKSNPDKTGIKYQKEMAVLDKQQQLLKEHTFQSGDDAKAYLERDLPHDMTGQPVNGGLDNIPIEQIRAAAGNNVTKQLAVDRYEKQRNVKEAFAGHNFADAALLLKAKNDPTVDYLLKKAGGVGGMTEATSAVPLAVKGQAVLEAAMNPDVQELAAKDPNFKREYGEAIYNFPVEHPEAATKLLAQAIANKREELGLNNSWANVVGKESTDKIVDGLIKDGTLPANYKFTYEKQIRPKLGTWRSIGRGIGNAIPGLNQAINESPIPTPGVLENIEQGAENFEKSTASSIAHLTGITDAAQSDAQQTYLQLKKEAETPAFEPKGIHKLSMYGGQMIPFALGMAAGGEALQGAGLISSPTLANATSLILATHGDNVDRSKTLFPGSNMNQALYTAVMDGVNGVMAGSVPGRMIPKLLRSAEPEIASTLKDMTSGKITTEAAKNSITNFVTNAAKTTLSGAKFMAVTGAVDNLLQQVLQGKGIDFSKTIDEAWDKAKMGAISSLPLAAAEAVVKNSKGFKSNVNDIASNPDYYKNLAAQTPGIDESIIQNIEHAGAVKQELTANNVPESQHGSYLLHSLNEKINKEAAEKATDPTIRQSYMDAAKRSHEIKEGILKGIPEDLVVLKQATKEVKELYNNGFLKKGTMETLESKKTAESEGKFDEDKVKPFLKFVAQQANNITEDGKFNVENDARKSAAKSYPSQLIDIANEMFPEFKQTAEEYDAGQRISEPVELNPKLPEDYQLPEQAEQPQETNIQPINTGGKNAVQESSAGSVLQHPQETTGSAGSERAGMEQGKQGNEAAGTQPPIPKEENIDTGEEKNVTGVKKAITTPLRHEMGLPPVELPKMSGDLQGLQAAKERIDGGATNPLDLVNRILDKKEGYRSEDEVDDMNYYAHQLNKAATDLQDRYDKATSTDEKAAIASKQQQLSDETDRMTEASITAGNKWGKIGGKMKVVIDDQFNPSREKAIIKAAYGGEIPKDVQEKLDAAIKDRNEAISARNKSEEILRQKEAELQAEKMKKGRTSEAKGTAKEKRKTLLDDLKAAKEEHEKWLKDNGIQKQGLGFTLTGKMIQIIGKIAKTYIDEGAEKLSEVIDKVHELVKDLFPGVEKNDIRDAIALHEAGRLTTKAEGLEKKISEGNLQPTVPKLKINAHNNSAWVAANQRVAKANFQIRTLKQNAFNSKRNMFQKLLVLGSKLVRFDILSGKNVLYKLASALAIGGAAKRIPEQAFGTMWSNIYKGIARKAPIEGFPNVKSEAKFYGELLNLKKLVHETWQIAKNHASTLDQQNGKIYYDDLSEMFMPGKQTTVGGKAGKTALNVVDRILTLPMDVHQMIKNPLKRSTYEASLNSAMAWAEKTGLDINDPLVRNSMENMAYLRANYEIFQENRFLSRKFNEAKTKWEKSGNPGAAGKFLADFLIPISTVPTNIAARALSTSPLGLVRGNYLAFKAFRNGIENLTPQQGDAVMRALKQGSLGTALWLIGWFGYSHFGGLYSKFDPNKKRKGGDLQSDEMEVNGQMIPKPVQHALPLEVMQLAATAARIYHNYRDTKNASTFESTYNAALGATGSLAEQIPIIETGKHLIGGVTDPYDAKKLKEDMLRRVEPQILRETGVIESSPQSTKKTRR